MPGGNLSSVFAPTFAAGAMNDLVILCKFSMRSEGGAVQQEIVGANDWKILWAKMDGALRRCGAAAQNTRRPCRHCAED